jgi:hypothetical protein
LCGRLLGNIEERVGNIQASGGKEDLYKARDGKCHIHDELLVVEGRLWVVDIHVNTQDEQLAPSAPRGSARASDSSHLDFFWTKPTPVICNLLKIWSGVTFLS